MSCARMDKGPGEGEAGSLGVDAFSANSRLVPDISKNKTNTDGVGPVPDEVILSKNTAPKKIPAVSLIFGPGLNRVRCYIPILKNLEREGVKIHIVSGSGLGAVLASMYAMGLTPDKIEWQFHKFGRSAKDYAPYSKDWMELVDQIFLQQLKGKKIQNGVRRLILPIYNIKQNKTVYLSRGDLYWTLEQQLTLGQSLKKSNFMAPFHKEIYNLLEMRRMGADIVGGLDVLTNSVEFKNVDHFLLGTYGKAAAIAKKEIQNLGIYLTVDDNAPRLDSIDGMPEYLQRCNVSGAQFATRMKDYVAKWGTEEKVE
ncbi:MAG: hypothetical protein EP319_01100 [Deltaproteobacteria bacterium]|nr:MAG: hypothetical protein EP319_01100 [Deltaproteobacteria bacterium]